MISNKINRKKYLNNTIQNYYNCIVLIIIMSLMACTSIQHPVPKNTVSTTGQSQLFNDNWLFSLGDDPQYNTNSFDDKSWRKLDLPHDWAIEGPFSKKYNARNGGLPVFGAAWYRKHFTLARTDNGKVISVTFEGAMDNSEVYVNGQLVGKRPYGYISFQYDITPYVNFGEQKNVIAVKLNPLNYSSRWYAGAGLYRNTWLDIKEPLHIKKWGTYVTTPQVGNNKALVNLEIKLNEQSKLASQPTFEDGTYVVSQIINKEGIVVATDKTKLEFFSEKDRTINQNFTVLNPSLWDIETPYLYSINTRIIQSGKVIDSQQTTLGIRHIEFKSDSGFWLNGRRVQIQGVCLHHDNGPLGAVANRRAIQRKLEIMKAMGANAIRTSHNPPSRELVEFADEMGMLLKVEAFDVWKTEKATVVNGYNIHFDEWAERDLRDMVIQNRNHPSIIMWGSGNEVYEQKEQDGWKITKRFSDIIHSEDPSRLVTVGFDQYPDFINNNLYKQVDIIGLNYKANLYSTLQKEFPNWLVLASESAGVASTRGVYHFPLEKYQKHPSLHVTSYDLIAPPWAYIPDWEFKFLDENPHVMGEFFWTGFDYLGEPTPYGGRDHGNNAYWNRDWPARSSSFGAVDLSGFPKDRYYLYQSKWTTKPMVHLLPHWNWPDQIGKKIPVMVYTNAEEVELFVNGKSLGTKIKGKDLAELPFKTKFDDEKRSVFKSPYRLMWQVEYQPGEIKAIAKSKGKVVASKIIYTAKLPQKIFAQADRDVIQADGSDLSYISVDIHDKDGNFCPTADNLITFEIEGPGEVAGVGNGNSATVEPFQANYRKAFNGKALLILKGIKGQAGDIKIRIHAEGLKDYVLNLKSL